MPRRPYETQSFHPGMPVVVRRPFVGHGHHWQRGEVFDWKRKSIAVRKVCQLYDCGKIRHLTEDETVNGVMDIPEPEIKTPELEPRLITEDPLHFDGDAPEPEQDTPDPDPHPTPPAPEPGTEATPPATEVPEPEVPTPEATESPPEPVPLVDPHSTDSMVILRQIAKTEGAPLKISKVDQRASIIANRAAKGNV